MRKSKFKLNLRKLNYKKYFKQFKLDRLIDVKKFKTSNFSPSYIFENNNKTPYPPDLEDLIRIHYIITSRRVTTVLEFGVGYSTLFIADALKNNYGDVCDAGIIDPAKVSRSALQNATSIAGMILTTECVVVNNQEIITKNF